jgi:hypothetical protein
MLYLTTLYPYTLIPLTVHIGETHRGAVATSGKFEIQYYYSQEYQVFQGFLLFAAKPHF